MHKESRLCSGTSSLDSRRNGDIFVVKNMKKYLDPETLKINRYIEILIESFGIFVLFVNQSRIIVRDIAERAE